MVDAPAERRPRLALTAFGYWHYGLLLAIVAVAAGLKKAVGDPYDPLDGVDRRGARGRARRCSSSARSASGGRSGSGGAASGSSPPALALATIPLGTEVAATAQVGALAAIVAGALVVEGLRRVPSAEASVTD